MSPLSSSSSSWSDSGFAALAPGNSCIIIRNRGPGIAWSASESDWELSWPAMPVPVSFAGGEDNFDFGWYLMLRLLLIVIQWWTGGMGSNFSSDTDIWFTVIKLERVAFVILALRAVLMAFFCENPLSTAADEGERVPIILVNRRTFCKLVQFSQTQLIYQVCWLLPTPGHHLCLETRPFFNDPFTLIVTKYGSEVLDQA